MDAGEKERAERAALQHRGYSKGAAQQEAGDHPDQCGFATRQVRIPRFGILAVTQAYLSLNKSSMKTSARCLPTPKLMSQCLLMLKLGG